MTVKKRATPDVGFSAGGAGSWCRPRAQAPKSLLLAHVR